MVGDISGSARLLRFGLLLERAPVLQLVAEVHALVEDAAELLRLLLDRTLVRKQRREEGMTCEFWFCLLVMVLRWVLPRVYREK